VPRSDAAALQLGYLVGAAAKGASRTQGIGLELSRRLQQAVGIGGPTLTHHLDAMESSGLVVRSRVPGDRRAVRVELTAEGDEAFHRLRSAALVHDTRLRSGLSAEEVATLRTLLGRLRENVSD